MASAMVPEVKVITEDDYVEGTRNLVEGLVNLEEQAPQNPQMLAPPPRFIDDDDDDEDSNWVDCDTSSAFLLEFPEVLLSSYTSLKPRLSYR